MNKNWIAIASAEHVRLGRAQGFMQVCHGKATPLKRIQPNDWIIYYSPTETFRGKDRLQSFTAIGKVKVGAPYSFAMSEDFCPFRRDVHWLNAEETSILPLLDRLEFTAGKKNWGYQFRFGLFSISDSDRNAIAQCMNADINLDESFFRLPVSSKQYDILPL